MKNQSVADIFYEVADLLEIQGVPFKPRAYRRAAHTLETLGEDIETFHHQNTLHSIPGIGDALAKKITEILETGTLAYLDKLRREIPGSLITLMDIPHVGPKKALVLYKQLGITTIDDLKQACEEQKLRNLEGFGETMELNILKGIKMLNRTRGRTLLGRAHETGDQILRYLKTVKGVKDISLAGSLRRMKETIGDIDILVATTGSPHQVMDHFVTYPATRETLMRGDTKASIILTDGTQVDLRVVKPESFGAALQYFTGSKAHNIRLRTLAKEKGLKISEYGIYTTPGGEKLAGDQEEEMYHTLGLSYIPPELREDQGEIEGAQKHTLPTLVGYGDIRGDLHVHTEWSDGVESIATMAHLAQAQGYQYLGIADHSQSLKIAGGLSEERLLKQVQEIRRIEQGIGGPFRVFAGTECDIKADGSLDYPDHLLQELDYVCAAIHSRFKMNPGEMTTRVLRALGNDHVTILTHPTGRLIGQRDPYEIDLEKVMEAARDNRVFLEINAFPDRLDLNDVNARLAKDRGVQVALGTDSHSRDHLHYMRYGIATARRGWLEKKDILNTRSLKEVSKQLGVP